MSASDDDNNSLRHHGLELSTTSLSHHPEHEGIPETQGLLSEEDEEEPQGIPAEYHRAQHLPPAREFLIRALALLCACSLSIGSH